MDVKKKTRIVLSPRTVLNGGERGQERVGEAKKKRRRLKTRPRTNLNGGDLVRSTFLVFTFTLPLPLWPLSLPLFLSFFPSLGAAFIFLGCNGEKEHLELGRSHPALELLDGLLPVPIVA